MKQSLKYHKILSLYKRNMKGDKKFIIGEWSTPELRYLQDNEWIFTEKVDGTNIRVMYNGEDIIFGGKSDNAQLPVPLIYKLDEHFKVMEQRKKLEEIFPKEEGLDVVLYGEGYGNKIQKSGGNYISDGVDFVLFDVWINGIWLERHNVDDIAQKLEITSVPIIGKGTLEQGIYLCKTGFKSKWGDFIAEGIVARPSVEMFTRKGERIITKVKYKDFH